MSDFDLIVVGAGPGGYVAAIRAAQLGMNVACVEKEKQLGGTCLRIGCIPSKALLDSSEHYYQALNDFKVHGIEFENISLNLGNMLKRKDKVVKTLTGGVASLLKKNKVEHISGTATLVGNNQVKVGDETYSAKSILIATGSAEIEIPSLPFDGKQIVNSTDALDFDEVPKRLFVVGGGFIGLEMGSVWARLGSDVVVVEMMDRIVPTMDKEISKELQKVLEKQGLKFMLSTKASSVDLKKDGVTIQLETSEGETVEEKADKILVAVGRKPFTSGLGLEDVGVELDERGRVKVDVHYQTNISGIYAIGDVIDGPMLAHKAEEEGIACVELLAGQAGHVNYDLIPGVVYTWPEVASVGKTEDQCKEEGLNINVGKFAFRANGRARAAEENDGFVKIIADAYTDTILGVHILGPRASDLIAECVTAMEFGASAEDLARTCHAHPTFPEAIKEAALDAGGRVIHS